MRNIVPHPLIACF